MAGWAGVRRASLLGGWLLLLGCGVGASHDTDLLMRAPFARDLGWTDAASVCRFRINAIVACDDDNNNVISIELNAIRDALLTQVRQVRIAAAANITLLQEWGKLAQLGDLALTGFYGSLPPEWGSEGAFPHLETLSLSFNSISGGLPPQWGRGGAFPKLQTLSMRNSNLSGSLPAQWGVHKDINITLLEEQGPASLAALPFPSIEYLDLSLNNITGGLPLEWTNNPHFLEATVRLDETLLKASQAQPDFAKGICTHPYRYEHYRNWSVGRPVTDRCDTVTDRARPRDKLFVYSCFIPVSEAGLDPCSLDQTTKVVLIAVWSSCGLVALLACLVSLIRRQLKPKGEAVASQHQHSKRFEEWLNKRMSPEHRIHVRALLRMGATVISYWADIASDVPVLVESWEKKGIFFFILLAFMLGSHIVDAILIARYALVTAEKEQGHNEASASLFSRLLQKAAWFMMYFLIAILALPALDVLCLASGPGSSMPADAVFKIDLEGYQTMRLVIGAFRTIPTAIALTVIATLGNNPKNGTYFTPTVVGVSLGLSALQIIILTLQIRQKAAAAKEKTHLRLLRSVFSLKSLEPRDPNQTSGDNTILSNGAGSAPVSQAEP